MCVEQFIDFVHDIYASLHNYVFIAPIGCCRSLTHIMHGPTGIVHSLLALHDHM